MSGVFIFISIIFSLALIKGAYDIYRISVARSQWKQSEGSISRVSAEGWTDQKKKMKYYLSYEYEAGGLRFIGSRYNPAEDSLKSLMKLKSYRELAASAKEGDRVTVYYDPMHPEDAVLNTDFLRVDFLFSYLVLGFIVMTVTMVVKEANLRKYTEALAAGVPGGEAGKYNGEGLLPSIDGILKDDKQKLVLNTGMTSFWSFGLPFFATTFIGAMYMTIYWSEMNPGWSLVAYMSVTAALLLMNISSGLLAGRFRHMLEIDSSTREVRETSYSFFRKNIRKYGFADIDNLRLYQEKWQSTNTMRQWTMYMQTKGKKSLFISYRHRDIQPASSVYLGILKKRIDYMIFGARAI